MLQACCFGEGKTPHWGGGMTMSEYRVHYTVWAILASPLILGADIRYEYFLPEHKNNPNHN